MSNFDKVKSYLVELEYAITYEDREDTLFVIENEEKGIKNMVVDVEDSILVLEQHIFDVKHPSIDLFQALLQKNREIIHGAFVLDNQGKRVLFRDTLQVETLDLDELEASINSLSLLLTEFATALIELAKN